jgi:transitional endoplasmic reticulum ATPase
VILAGEDDKHEKQTFQDVLRDQIKKLRKQLDSSKPSDANELEVPGAWRQPAVPQGGLYHVVGEQQRRLDSRLANQTRIWDAGVGSDGARHGAQMPGEMPGAVSRDERDLRSMANAAARVGRSFIF